MQPISLHSLIQQLYLFGIPDVFRSFIQPLYLQNTLVAPMNTVFIGYTQSFHSYNCRLDILRSVITELYTSVIDILPWAILLTLVV